MKARAAVVSALAVTALATVPLAAQAARPAHAATVSQPYTHVVADSDWGTGGTYVSTGGDIKLNLKTIPKATEVFVEQCEGSDLGDVAVFMKKAPSHVLATEVAKGTCFIVLFHAKDSKGGYVVKGDLSY